MEKLEDELDKEMTKKDKAKLALGMAGSFVLSGMCVYASKDIISGVISGFLVSYATAGFTVMSIGVEKFRNYTENLFAKYQKL